MPKGAKPSYMKLDHRIQATSFQQFAPKSLFSDPVENPITGRLILKNAARSQRVSEVMLSKRSGGPSAGRRDSVEECQFCTGRTTSTLFYIGEAKGKKGGKFELCDENASITAARRFFDRENPEKNKDAIRQEKYGKRVAFKAPIELFFEMLRETGGLKEMVRKDMDARRWLWRSFLNLVPSFPILPEKCVLIATHPEYHRLYLDQFPPRVVASLIEAWKIWEEYVDWWNECHREWVEEPGNGQLRVLPFVNGGRRPEAGQTIICFHSQVYVTRVPEHFKEIEKARRVAQGCPVCKILGEKELRVYRNKTMRLYMHPAPLRNFSMLAMPRKCEPNIGGVRNSDVADVLQRAIAIYRRFLGAIPAYNISLRCGPEVGHLHIQIVPKTETNVVAGYEDLTNKIIITQDPAETARLLRRRYA